LKKQNQGVPKIVLSKPESGLNTPLPADLAEIATLWPKLSPHIKAAIKALNGKKFCFIDFALSDSQQPSEVIINTLAAFLGFCL